MLGAYYLQFIVTYDTDYEKQLGLLFYKEFNYLLPIDIKNVEVTFRLQNHILFHQSNQHVTIS